MCLYGELMIAFFNNVQIYEMFETRNIYFSVCNINNWISR